jgi:hypothetical protein
LIFGILDGVFDSVPLEDMPSGYMQLRNELKLAAMELRCQQDIISKKIITYGGLEYLSAENVNKTNKERVDLFKQYLKRSYPTVEVDEIAKPSGTVEDLVAEYKRLFPQQSSGNQG